MKGTVYVGAVLLLTVIGALTFLANAGIITGTEAYSAFTTIIVAGVSAIGVHTGVTAGARAASTNTVYAPGQTPPVQVITPPQ